jgi:threonine dehydrogenase-like Zn-dependent dehydrogenase
VTSAATNAGARTGDMRAAVIAEPRRARVSPAPKRAPGDGEVRVRIEGCGVCGSNLPVWCGQPWFRYPLAAGAPGHEGWGWIDALGDNVSDLAVGDRVAMLSAHAFAEYDVTAAGNVLRLPPQLDHQPFPGEAVACAFNVFGRSAIRPGDTVAVVGAGFLGTLIVELAAQHGARVVALSRRPYAREIAASAGAAATVATDDHDAAVAACRDFAGEGGCDCVIEAVGSQAALDLATKITRERGRLIIAGYHQDGPRQVDMQTWNWRGLDVINAHERDPQRYLDGMSAAIDAAARGEIDVARLCTHTVALDRLGDALDMLRERPDGFLKAVVAP